MKQEVKKYSVRYNTKSTSDKDLWRLLDGDTEILVSDGGFALDTANNSNILYQVDFDSLFKNCFKRPSNLALYTKYLFLL